MKVKRILFYLFCLISFVSFSIHSYSLGLEPQKVDFFRGYIQGEGPVAIIRYLESIHDEVASNKPGAEKKLRISLEKTGEEILNFPESTWNNPENLYALITYLFIGGDPKVVEALLKTIPTNIVPKEIIDGALAYSYNKPEDFLEAFSEKNLNKLDLPIDLRMAIYLGTASEDDIDPTLALKRLDFVRIDAPGSLMEEAALRREVALAYYSDDVTLIGLLARNYMARFSKSPYEKNFWEHFAVSMVHLAPRLTDQQMSDLLEPISSDLRYVILTHISRSALIKGNMVRAHDCAEKALKIAALEGYEKNAVSFYYAASSIGSVDIFQAKKILKTIDTVHLNVRDLALYAACMKLSEQIIKNNMLAPITEVNIGNATSYQKDKTKDIANSYNVSENKVKSPFLETSNFSSLSGLRGSSNNGESSEGEEKKNNEGSEEDKDISDSLLKLPVPEICRATDMEVERKTVEIGQFISDIQDKLHNIDALLKGVK